MDGDTRADFAEFIDNSTPKELLPQDLASVSNEVPSPIQTTRERENKRERERCRTRHLPQRKLHTGMAAIKEGLMGTFIPTPKRLLPRDLVIIVRRSPLTVYIQTNFNTR